LFKKIIEKMEKIKLKGGVEGEKEKENEVNKIKIK
jgi:hypothetical protein